MARDPYYELHHPPTTYLWFTPVSQGLTPEQRAWIERNQAAALAVAKRIEAIANERRNWYRYKELADFYVVSAATMRDLCAAGLLRRKDLPKGFIYTDTVHTWPFVRILLDPYVPRPAERADAPECPAPPDVRGLGDGA